MDKVLSVTLNGNRTVVGVLRGFDAFLNIVLEDATEERAGGAKVDIGQIVIRGNSVLQFECKGLVDRQEVEAA
jgi:small nuclear ribonucleoprotein G